MDLIKMVALRGICSKIKFTSKSIIKTKVKLWRNFLDLIQNKNWEIELPTQYLSSRAPLFSSVLSWKAESSSTEMWSQIFKTKTTQVLCVNANISTIAVFLLIFCASFLKYWYLLQWRKMQSAFVEKTGKILIKTL